MADTSCGVYSPSPRGTFTSWPIFRLIDLTVRSGASTHWLRAAVPTSSRPSSDSPTTDGRMGSPSSASTRGWPPSTTAISLLVVPRSIPTINSAMTHLSRRTPSASDGVFLRSTPALALGVRPDYLATLTWAKRNTFPRHRYPGRTTSTTVPGGRPASATTSTTSISSGSYSLS